MPKKKKYDEQLNFFHKNNLYDFSELNLEDTEKFNEKFSIMTGKLPQLYIPSLKKEFSSLIFTAKN